MKTKFKIQTGSVGGWADIKVSIDDGPYEDDLYDTRADAQAEINVWVRELDGHIQDDYRIVTADTKADFDLYD